MFNFENLRVYKDTKPFVSFVYRQTNKIKDFGLKDQIRRAAVSVLLNIAEGSSSGTKKQLKRFLWISLGSLSEVVAGFDLAQELSYITKEEYRKLYEISDKLARQLNKLIYS